MMFMTFSLLEFVTNTHAEKPSTCAHLPQSDISMCVRKLCEFLKMGLAINLHDFYLCVLAFHALYHIP